MQAKISLVASVLQLYAANKMNAMKVHVKSLHALSTNLHRHSVDWSAQFQPTMKMANLPMDLQAPQPNDLDQ